MITVYIILLTTAVSLIALYLNPNIIEWGVLKPYRTVREKRWYELISSGLLHGSFAHLFVNMFVLFFFGVEFENEVGSFHFLALYTSGLLASSLPTLYKFRDDPAYATLGASGAVGSVLFAFIFLNPTEKLILILLPIPIPAWLFAIFYLMYSIYESKQRRGKVNHEAHIAGALWGILYMILFVPESLGRFMSLFGMG